MNVYSDMCGRFDILSYPPPKRGTVCCCRVCGANKVTLYKDGEERICGKCRRKQQMKEAALSERGGADA